MLCSFDPVIGSEPPSILILGSMPGVRSLEQQQYYAHPRNAFWPIMGELFGATPKLPYAERLACLTKHGIVLWDVLKHCERQGSLDSAIRGETEVPNAIPELLQQAPTIELILFNGGKAATAFRRHVEPMLTGQRVPESLQLPSTSPANARMNFAAKLAAWKIALAR